jgi:prepilin-type N-terminal cleavage/methylation domain-containing protein
MRCSRRRGSSDRDRGMTLIELVVAIGLLSVVSLMSTMVLFGTRKVAEEVTWRANASSEIRDVLDATFADLSSARPPAVCLDATCTRITESRSVAGDPTSPPPSVLVSASDTSVCYLSQRRDPIGLVDPQAVLQPYWKVCLVANPAPPGRAASERRLELLAYAPASTGTAYGQLDATAGFASTPSRQRPLGVIDVSAGAPFGYTDLEGATVSGADLALHTWDEPGGPLSLISKVDMRIRLTSFDARGKATATRRLTFTAALRSSRYEQERYWNGDRSAVTP